MGNEKHRVPLGRQARERERVRERERERAGEETEWGGREICEK